MRVGKRRVSHNVKASGVFFSIACLSTGPKSDMMDVLKENWFEELEDCIVEYSQIQFGEELGKGPNHYLN